LKQISRDTRRVTLISGSGGLFSKLGNSCPGQRGGKADCVPLNHRSPLNNTKGGYSDWHRPSPKDVSTELGIQSIH